ncbi:hypothetical protein ACFL0R_02420 [Pseudomonadota bacterium]
MEAISELINAINTTPFRTTALVIGFLALSVGYGLKIKAVIDVDNINKTYAKTVGVVLLILGFMLYMPDITKQSGIDDPFLPYYVVSVFIVAIFSGVALRFTSGQLQVKTLKGYFILLAILVSLVVVWRGIVVYFYVTSTGEAIAPLGFNKPGSNFLPYFFLLSAGVAVIAWLIYTNTRQPENSENRFTIFQYFSVLCVYLGACRVVWEVVDLIGKKVLSAQ